MLLKVLCEVDVADLELHDLFENLPWELLENKLMARQPREHHEAKGRIKDQAAHAQIQFEKKRYGARAS